MSPITKLALPVLAAAGSAYAASCSVSATTTIQNSGDATGLSSCSTFSGSIAIATGTSDSISLDGIKEIDGDLVCTNNSAIQSISASDLTTIKGTFLLDTVQVLSTLSFAKLATVTEIKWNALANLQQLDFGVNVTEADTVDIENTQLTSLAGLDLVTIDNLKIANNRYITDITMQLGNVSNILIIEANNPEANVSFPEMIWANNMTFVNVSGVSVPKLESLNGSLGFHDNAFEGFAAPKLTEVGGALSFVSNTEMGNLSLPALTTITQNLQISNNTKLHTVSIPKLKSIGGALDMNGNMTDIELPALQDVKGAFNIQSTGNITSDCSTFSDLHSQQKIHGKYVCAGEQTKPGGQGSTPTASGAGAKKTSGASALNVQNNALGLMGLAAAFLL